MLTTIFRTIALGLFLLMNIDVNAKDTLSTKLPKELTMKEAIDKGMLNYKIFGLYNPCNSDCDGMDKFAYF